MRGSDADSVYGMPVAAAPDVSEWFPARLFPAAAPEQVQPASSGRRKRNPHPQLLYGVKDVAGQPVDLLPKDQVEVLIRGETVPTIWRITGDPEVLRKRVRVLGWLAHLERVEEETDRPVLT